MPLYKPSELRTFLQGLGAVAKKRLSQNFIIDGNILDKIVEFAQIKRDDCIVEIGPGPGALTEKLIASECELFAVEKDLKLASMLTRFSSNRCHIFCQDFLKFALDKHVGEKKVKVVANIPYHITTAILERLTSFYDCIESAILMMQEEVARRFTASKNPKEYSTLFLHYYTIPQYGFYVSPRSFYPVPKVGSAVIKLDFQKRHPVGDETAFFSMAKAAFLQKRKRIAKTLSVFYKPEKIENALSSIQKPTSARPEELSLEEWVHLTQILLQK